MKRAHYFFICLIFANGVACCRETLPTRLQFQGNDKTVINAKFSMPLVKESSYLAVWVQPSLNVSYIPDSVSAQPHSGPGYNFLIKKRLLEKGIINVEFQSQRDSVVLAGTNYPSATLQTQAQDVDAALAFIRSKKELKRKKIILIGCSEGGMSGAIAASKDHKIHGLLLIGTPGVKGEIFLDYQNKCADTIACGSFGVPEFYQLVYSTITFQETFDESPYGFFRFRDSCRFPLKKILDKNLESGLNYATNAQEIMQYINNKWEKENPDRADNPELRKIINDYRYYCRMFGALQYIQPQQVELHTWNPELYFPKIKCPVLAVYGEKDRQLAYKSSLENIKKMLAEGGNRNFMELVYPQRDHILQYWHNRPPLEEKDLEPIIDWVSQL